MIEREFRTGEYTSAKLAGVPVTEQDILSGKRSALLRDMPVGQQANYRRHAVRMRCGVNFGGMELFGLRYSFEH